MAWQTVVGGALAGGGLLGSLFNRPKYDTPDITGELNNIRSLFEQLRAQSEVNLNRQAAQGRRQAVSNLAARGTLRSPVAEYPFQAIEGERLNAIANSNAQLAGQEAGLRAALLGSLLKMRSDQQGLRNQANAAIFGNLTGIGNNLLLASLMQPNASAGVPRTGTVNAGNRGGWLPYYG